ncbi:trans-sulfuration enzyme family protein [Halomarina oriensis]|uniref:Aminotransferase class V-fold PLP-dependent enzyme n=1 Tax=Halomarina oriensis TaxID=671145 RepID=A0A6B0GN27_9EURY|nr:PLP-dependent aspartate aminotransferase family protein [Halomarina oriensis]MWG35341.1 aminotransferase class V-fold PLP-dependent enzyme [Halomarina oriensis]
MSHDSHVETRAVSHGEEPAPETGRGDVVSPIHLASTFALPALDTGLSLEDVDPARGEFLYSRLSNPTRHAVEQRLAALEGGTHGFAFSSGTAAINTALLATVEPGDHVVAFDDLYAGTRRMLEELFVKRLNVEVSFVDATDTGNVEAAIREDTRLVWMETPTNPLMKLCDIGAIASVAHEHGALLGVDNTFMSPLCQRPLALGADLVAHSTTKYLNGHSDSVGGALVTDCDELAESLGFLQQVALGNMLAPFDSYLLLRGTKTLPVRMRQHEANARRIAEYLEDHEQVSRVLYPGLESHPQYDLAREQQTGFGGVLSFELDGDIDDVVAFLGNLEQFTLAVSLGGVESLIECPAAMTHEPIPREEREAVGITDTLIRVSVGIEHVEDLLADLDRGFAAVDATHQSPSP